MQLETELSLPTKSGTIKVTLTRNVKGHRTVRKENRISLPTGNPLVLGPHESKLVILPYQIQGDGVQTIVGTGQVKGLIVFVTWR